ncbi:unnamed protein product [Notodromas monacha]|uniref:Innexin n=1 Tax=Notodromas monacha TaxID=399045 RepID=A0A7R9BVH8_9CRUS|nr:unnamed protein product [Notodromas monacha]CAG0922524.1 unnamed protein product [Notodromas monacha]
MEFRVWSDFAKLRQNDFDNAVSKLHHVVTTRLLLLFTVLTALYVCPEDDPVMGGIFGGSLAKPIVCMAHGQEAHPAILNYCWVTSAYTLESELNKKPGPVGDEEPIFQAFYQWVPFMLLLQAMLFYAPHYFWQNALRNHRLDKVIEASMGRTEVAKSVAKFISTSLGRHRSVFLAIIVKEILSLAVVGANIYFTDVFLGGQFTTYGIEVLKLIDSDGTNRTDPMIKRFPRVTKCTWHSYGPSGTIKKEDYMCLLSINMMSEKIYIFLWFWFLLLALVSVAHLCKRLIEILFARFRTSQLVSTIGNGSSKNYVTFICKRGNIGDWFLLREIMRNVHSVRYDFILSQIVANIKREERLIERM